MVSKLKEFYINLTIKQLTNKSNTDFFIGTLSLTKVKKLLENADEELVDIFWTAYSVAENIYLKGGC